MDHQAPTRLAFVDDHPTLLQGLTTIFSADRRYDIVAAGSSVPDALRIASEMTPEVMILDLSMPGDVFAAIDVMTEASPTLKLVVFTAFANVDLAIRALDAGAHAFVLKGRPYEDLFEAIEAARRGELYVSPGFAPQLVAGYRNWSRRETVKLSARERQLLDCLMQGNTNKEIAATLKLTEKTVKHYMTNLMNKLQVKNRVEVVLAAQRLREPTAFSFKEPER